MAAKTPQFRADVQTKAGVKSSATTESLVTARAYGNDIAAANGGGKVAIVVISGGKVRTVESFEAGAALQPYQCRCTCGHYERRQLAEGTAGVPFSQDAVVVVADQCAACQAGKSTPLPTPEEKEAARKEAIRREPPAPVPTVVATPAADLAAQVEAARKENAALKGKLRIVDVEPGQTDAEAFRAAGLLVESRKEEAREAAKTEAAKVVQLAPKGKGGGQPTTTTDTTPAVEPSWVALPGPLMRQVMGLVYSLGLDLQTPARVIASPSALSIQAWNDTGALRVSIPIAELLIAKDCFDVVVSAAALRSAAKGAREVGFQRTPKGLDVVVGRKTTTLAALDVPVAPRPVLADVAEVLASPLQLALSYAMDVSGDAGRKLDGVAIRKGMVVGANGASLHATKGILPGTFTIGTLSPRPVDAIIDALHELSEPDAKVAVAGMVGGGARFMFAVGGLSVEVDAQGVDSLPEAVDSLLGTAAPTRNFTTPDADPVVKVTADVLAAAKARGTHGFVRFETAGGTVLALGIVMETPEDEKGKEIVRALLPCSKNGLDGEVRITLPARPLMDAIAWEEGAAVTFGVRTPESFPSMVEVSQPQPADVAIPHGARLAVTMTATDAGDVFIPTAQPAAEEKPKRQRRASKPKADAKQQA